MKKIVKATAVVQGCAKANGMCIGTMRRLFTATGKNRTIDETVPGEGVHAGCGLIMKSPEGLGGYLGGHGDISNLAFLKNALCGVPWR